MAAVHDGSEKPDNKTKSRRKMFNGVCYDTADEARKKVIATVSRSERACKRTGEPSVPFCERGGIVKYLAYARCEIICLTQIVK